MRRWLPFHMMLAVVIALALLSLQMVFARMRFKNFSAKEPLHALFPIHVEMPTH